VLRVLTQSCHLRRAYLENLSSLAVHHGTPPSRGIVYPLIIV
jgi:hypothetical protein